jgi:hypothetical protein
MVLTVAPWVHAGTAAPAVACADVPVEVQAADAADARDACLGARDAAAFFRSLALPMIEAVRIEIGAEFPPQVSRSAVGCFLERDRRVLLAPYASFRRHKTWFGVTVTRTLYRSVAAHEMAHALAGCAFARGDATIQAKEYVAYVAMFSAMDPSLRQRILQRYPGEAFESAEQLTPVLYMFDPMRFGVESYRHFARPDNGKAFLMKVLAGQALTD